MFNFIKKAGTGSGITSNSNNQTDKDNDKEKRKRDKKDRKEKQKRERASMSAEELLRLDEVRRSLKIRGRRKEKEKLPSGITADYTADFLASFNEPLPPATTTTTSTLLLNNIDNNLTQSDSSETSLNSLQQQQQQQQQEQKKFIGFQQQKQQLPTLPPKPPKRGILKTPRVNIINQDGLINQQQIDDNNLIRNTIENELITYQNIPLILPSTSSSQQLISNGIQNGGGGGGSTKNLNSQLLVITSTSSPSVDSLTDTTNSSFATPPFSLSPVGESQGYYNNHQNNNNNKWLNNLDDIINLPLPPIKQLKLPNERILTIKRQRPPRNDFGFSLRRAMILERIINNNNNNKILINMRAVIFAEPGTIIQHNNETGLLPGDKLLEVNGIKVDDKNREEIIDMIKASGDSVTLKVQPVAELSELSKRSGHDGNEIILDDSNIKGGTLRRSGSRRFNKSTMAKSEEHLEKEKEWLDTETVWLIHRGGFVLAKKLLTVDEIDENNDCTNGGKIRLCLDYNNEIINVDEDDIEKANPPQYDLIDDISTLRHLNESSILHILRQRYANNLIHTYAGNNNLLIINPMAPLAIYSEKVVSLFKGCKIDDMPPHIYSMAQSAYYTMLQTRRDQSIVFLGRSGSGKTTNFRHSIQYLITSNNINLNNTKLITVEKLLSIWTILENFGNCRTILNTNSTRFTQIFSLDYDYNGQIISANIQILLLEKLRILNNKLDDCSNETTFHIMQRFLLGLNEQLRKEFYLDNLLNSSGSNSNLFINLLPTTTSQQQHQQKIYNNIDDDKQRNAQIEFNKICQAFHILNITDNEQKLIFMVLAAIYHLGCAGAVKAGNNRYQFANPQAAQRAAQLLGTTIEELNRIIFGSTTTNTTTNSTTTNTLTRNNCNSNLKISPTDERCNSNTSIINDINGLDAIEAIIIGLYSEVFNCVASLINRSISSSTHTISSILLIDTPGFQNAATCGKQSGSTFDDLCHNYLNERLQLLFHHINLIIPRDRYLQENININNVDLNLELSTTTYNNDNNSSNNSCNDDDLIINPQPLVNLLDKTIQNSVIRTSQTNLLNINDKYGLLWLLDEETLYPNSNDNTFYKRLFQYYNDLDYQLLLRKSTQQNQFILQHLQGTNPVLYNIKNWLKFSRENPIQRSAVILLQESCKEDLSKLFISVRGLGCTSFSGSIIGIDGSQSLRRASSIRRTFTTSNAAIKRKSVCLQTKFAIDGLIETLRRTKIRFVHCLLPQHNAGFCETNLSLFNNMKTTATTTTTTAITTSQPEDDLINIPLLRSQIRGGQILDAVRLYKQGYPNYLPFNEFRRRFKLLAGNDFKMTTNPLLDERKIVEEMLLSMDLDLSTYRIGLSQVFFRNGILTQLESQRDENLTQMIINFQSQCRGYLSRKKLIKRKLQDLAVRCIQKNVRKFLIIKDWTWWRLLIKVKPLLNVHRTEEELKIKTDELEALKMKLEKVENERTILKHENEKLEAKLSEMTADLAEEHSTSTLATERLDIETSERIKLEHELNKTQTKNKELLDTNERLEMDLLYHQQQQQQDNDNNLSDQDDEEEVYKERYKRTIKELEFTKRRLQQQHEDDLEQLIGLKKSLEKKLNDSYEECNEQRQLVQQWKTKLKKLTNEMTDIKLLLQEQTSRNTQLEKKQRKFDQELHLLQTELKQEKLLKLELINDKELIIQEKFQLENSLLDKNLDLDFKIEKIKQLELELNEFLTQHTKLDGFNDFNLIRKQKIDLETKLQESNLELDDLLQQIQLLEQNKLRLEMLIESTRKDTKKELQLKDDELDELRLNFNKKLKLLEIQLENEYNEKMKLLRDKLELEKHLKDFYEKENEIKLQNEQLIIKLKRDIKRLKILLNDKEIQNENNKLNLNNKLLIRQLKNQIDDLELMKNQLLKNKQTIEFELNESQQQNENLIKLNKQFDERINQLTIDKNDLQLKYDENDEELNTIIKKYKLKLNEIQTQQLLITEQNEQIKQYEFEQKLLTDELNELKLKLSTNELNDDFTKNLLNQKYELKINELESKLELELITKSRQDIQIQRLKDLNEKLHTDLLLNEQKDGKLQDDLKKFLKTITELKDELNFHLIKENDLNKKCKDYEKEIQLIEQDNSTLKNDLKLALKRIEDLQYAIQGEFDDDVDDDDDDNNSISDDDDDDDVDDISLTDFTTTDKKTSTGNTLNNTENVKRLSNAGGSCTSASSSKDSSYA